MGGQFAKIPWSLGFTELKWTDPRHLHVLCWEMPHLRKVLLIGVSEARGLPKGLVIPYFLINYTTADSQGSSLALARKMNEITKMNLEL